ncbi:thioredoxin [uncultured Desulfovibrio sp.]|uniref:thioredoxin n=1 Tax=uncultured Desulfovibrio sp. TaxID=167968 RepID=UPI001C3BD7B5|nr:thioredoxin [uncultured Desulfovibrio sp.]HIX40241.1 thioredoxin [Candidatus Desulfovibrio intestinigallinarum]
MQFIVFGILLLTVFAIYFEARRRVAKHQQDIAEEKSEIAEETRMTAQMAVFSAPNDGTYVVAASEEMGAFYYRLLQRGKETVRVKLNLANVLNADLLINGTIQTVEADSGQTSLSNRASEVTALLLSHYPPEIVRSITTIGLRVTYNSDSGEQRNLDMLVLDDKDQRHKNSRIQVLKNTIWWWQYLRMAARQARRTQAMIDGATDETM